MGDEEAEYQWLPAPVEGQEEPAPLKFVKVPGKAKVTYPNGDQFDGIFNDAKKKHGRGVYTWSNMPGSNPWVPEDGYPEGKEPTVRYDGQYVDGKKHGIGKMSFPNGERYHGMWEHDRFHGEGTYYYSNGDIYSGQWRRGVKSGHGTFLYAADEAQLIGDWLAGKFVAGKWVMKDGTSWQGPFDPATGHPKGRGVFYFPNGMMQEGEYVRARVEPLQGDEEDDEDDPDIERRTQWRGGQPRQADAPFHVVAAVSNQL